MDLAASKTYAAERNLEDWGLEADSVLQAKLLLASDYLAERYDLKPEFTAAEQIKYDICHFKIAFDFLVNGDPSTRAERLTTKESSELTGVGKSAKEFADGEHDPYPGVTRLLAPLCRATQTPSVSFGKLVR